MSLMCSKFFLKLALRTQIFLKLSHASTLSILTEEIQAKTEERGTQTAIYCGTFLLQSLGTRNSYMCYCTVFALFYFEFERNFRVQSPRRVYLEGRFIGGFFALRVWEGLYLEGLIFQFYGIWQESIYLRMLRLQCSIIVEDAYRMRAYIVH